MSLEGFEFFFAISFIAFLNLSRLWFVIDKVSVVLADGDKLVPLLYEFDGAAADSVGYHYLGSFQWSVIVEDVVEHTSGATY